MVTLRTVRYNDRHNILSAYTLEAGRMSFLVPAGNGREAARRRALLMPLSLVECQSDATANRDIHRMHDVAPLMALHGIHAHPAKVSIAMFLAELLSHLLRESQADKAMFAFLADSIATLDVTPGSRAANFHIAFLMKMLRFLGIEPVYDTWRPGRVFDMADGVFRDSAPLHGKWLTAADSEALRNLSRISYPTMHLYRLGRSDRNAIVDRLLQYYSLHLAPLPALATLSVLRSL